MKNNLIFCYLLAFLCISCIAKLPSDYQPINRAPSLYPDYTDLSIPWNIAPLNFSIKEAGDDFISVAYSRKGDKLQVDGPKVEWDLQKWHRLLEENKGDTLYVDIYVKGSNKWYKFSTIRNYIAPEKIDNYISYRLIEPSYNIYEYLTINQRNLTNFKEEVIYNNSLLSRGEEGQCINCHSYQNYNKTGKMQFHVRQNKGGTVIVTPNGVKKVDLKTAYTISGGVYPAWHPYKNLIAYSVNDIRQYFHDYNKEKVEVMDLKSDLILYDVDKNEVREISADPNELKTFPAWSPDGKYLYYVAAQYPQKTTSGDTVRKNYKKYYYNIYRKAFNPQTLEFGKTEMIFDAASIHKSATFPRISPDGKYLLFTLGEYGNFHIWHKSSDLYLIDLSTQNVAPMKELNSPDVDSYHSWSSNGSWIIFSSRREDGSYTRPYIVYFKNGKGHKPFILPQKDPYFYAALCKSYNIPEFMVKPVTVTQRQLIQAIDKKPTKATFYNPGNKQVLKKDTIDAKHYFNK
jgi:dipeptidyl aminopeptidase/acylaminoacyl peptidase